MRGMILAAGFGTRLSELGVPLPKPLFPVCNVPLVRWAVSYLVGYGVCELVINLHHEGQRIRAALGDGHDLGARITYVEEEGEILGTGGGVRNVRDFLGEETCVVMNGKITIDADLHAALAHHQASGALATMVVKPDPEAARWGGIGVDRAGRVVSLLGEPALSAETREHLFTGIHLLQPAFLEALPEGPSCIVRAGYRPLFARGAPLAAYVHEGYFWDHSTPSRFLQGNLNLVLGQGQAAFPPGPARGVHPSAEIAADARVDHAVLVGAGVRVGSGVVLGPGTVLGPGAEISAGLNLERCVVFAGARVTESLSCAVWAADRAIPVDLTSAGPRTGPALGTYGTIRPPSSSLPTS
jgi:mannose-1-phosphate guanylyltransferase